MDLKYSLKRLFCPRVMVVLAGLLPGAAHAAIPGLPMGLLPARPAFSRDISDQAHCLPAGFGNDAASPPVPGETVRAAAPTLSQVLSRRLKVTPARGEWRWWALKVALPTGAANNRPLALDFDDGRVVRQVWINGKKVPPPDCSLDMLRYQGGAGLVYLPAGRAGAELSIQFEAQFVTQCHPNGWGRLRLRTVDAFECLRLLAPTGDGVRVENRSGTAQELEISATAYDYFGVPLATQKSVVAVKAFDSVQVPPHMDGGRAFYKVVYRARCVAGALRGQDSLEYWSYPTNQRYLVHQERAGAFRLNSGWQYAVSPVGEPAGAQPPTEGWKSVPQVPFYIPANEYKARHAWFRASLTVPDAWSGQVVQLLLPRVAYAAEIFVNGTPRGSVTVNQTPATVDLGVLPPGTHQLQLRLTDYTVGIKPEMVPAQEARVSLSHGSIIGMLHADTSERSAIGLSATPEISAAPPVRLNWVGVRTDTVQTKAVTAHYELRNDTGAVQSGRLKAVIYLGGARVRELAGQEITLAPGTTRQVVVKSPFPEMRFWSPESPTLYELRTTLVDAQGAVLDLRRDRFGCRQWGVQQDSFTLNGKKYHLYGLGHTNPDDYVWPRLPPSNRFIRHFFATESGLMGGIDAMHLADELGMVLKAESPAWGALGSGNHGFDDSRLYEASYQHIAAAYRAYPNFASNWCWDIGNELSFAGYEDRVDALFARIRQLDPTRLVTTGGSTSGLALGPATQMADLHGTDSAYYPALWWLRHPERRPEVLRTAGLFSRPPAAPPMGDKPQGEKWALRQTYSDAGLRHLNGKPLFLSESLYNEAPIAPTFGGNSAYYPQHWFWLPFTILNNSATRRNYFQFDRQADLPAVMAHVDRGITNALSPLAIFPLDRKARFWSGDKAALSFTLHNDTSVTQKVSVRYTLQDAGLVVATVAQNFELIAAQVVPTRVELPLTPGHLDKDFDLLIELTNADGSAQYRDWLRIARLERRPLGLPPGVQLSVYDPSAKVSAYLESSKVPFRKLDSLEALPGNGSLILVGPQALAEPSSGALRQLRTAVHAGARVVVLQQRNLPVFLDTPLRPHGSSLDKLSVVATSAEKPFGLLAGLADQDFGYWDVADGDLLVQRNPLEVPTRGNFKAYLRSGESQLRETSLLEVAEGKGAVLFCQLNVDNALRHDPMGHVLLRRFLQWPASAPLGQPRRSTALLAFENGKKTATALRNRFGLVADYFDTRPANFDFSAYQLLVVAGEDAGAMQFLADNSTQLQVALRAGTNLFVQGLSEKTAVLLAAATGTAVGVEDFALDRAYVDPARPEMEGLNNSDLFWEDYTAEGYKNIPLDVSQPLDMREAVGTRRLTGSLTPLLRPAFAAKASIGAGRLTVNLTRGLEYPLPAPQRVLNTLLLNAGADLRPAAPQAAPMVDASRFFSVDLRPAVNRNLADEYTAPVRGWALMGPQNDFRELPTGWQRMGVAWYDIINPAQNGGRALLALSGQRDKGVLADSALDIRVQAKADKLYFLHTAAWGEPTFTYRVWYAERKTWIPGQPQPYVDVKVTGGQNIADYWSATDMLEDKKILTGAQLAWAGENAASRASGHKIGLFAMSWENPHPEKEIDTIDILSPGLEGKGQPFIFAISGLKPP